MTASLYQSASSIFSPTVSVSGTAVAASFINRVSPEIIKIAFFANQPAQLKNVCRRALRIQHHVVVAPAPEVALLAQQIGHLVGLSVIELQGAQVQIHPAGLYLVGIEVDYGQDRSAAGITFEVRDQCLIVDAAETQAVI